MNTINKYLKISLFILIFSFFACQTAALLKDVENGIAIEKWPDETLKGTGPVKKFKKHGKWIYYHQGAPDQIMAEGIYQNGIKNSIWKYYYKNGILASEGMFKNNQKLNKWAEYYENSQIKSTANYTILEGSEEEPAKLKTSIEGIMLTYYENGEVWKEEEFRQGVKKGRTQEFYSSGQLKEVSWYENNIRNGKLNAWWPDGKLEMEGFIDLGKKTGKWQIYHTNGNLQVYYIYKNNVKHGYSKEYYPDGQLKTRGRYHNNQKNGIWVDYYAEGGLKFKGRYRIGKKHGRCYFYNEDGEKIMELSGLYKDGELQ